MSSALVSALIVALSVETKAVSGLSSMPQLIWLICPIALYVMTRLRVLTRAGEIAGQAVGSDVERAYAVHALLEHDPGGRIGEQRQYDQRQMGQGGGGVWHGEIIPSPACPASRFRPATVRRWRCFKAPSSSAREHLAAA
jgi:hypothetical protein